MLRVHQFRLARIDAEKRRIEQVDFIQDRAGRNEVGILCQIGGIQPRPAKIFVRKEPDRLHPAREILPELRRIARARKTARETDNCNALRMEFDALAHGTF